MVDGAFDPIHPGHVRYFHQARALGAPLLCNICPDALTAQKHPVLIPAHERAQILDALDLIRYVHVSDRPTAEILRQLQPRYYVKGKDWCGKLPADQIAAMQGRDIIYTDEPTHSSTAIVQKLMGPWTLIVQAPVQPDVDAFERLVQSQPSADRLWEPVTPFDVDARRTVEGQHPALIKDVFQPKRVIDAGCGPLGHLVMFLRELDVDAHGFDVQAHYKYPALMRESLTNPYLVDDEYGPISTEFADLAICREVLEHLPLREFKQAITNLCKLSSRFVYVTTRFAKSPAHFLSVDTSDSLDPTHITMLNQDFLRTLFVLEGFKRRADLEQQMDHKKLGRVLVYERG